MCIVETTIKHEYAGSGISRNTRARYKMPMKWMYTHKAFDVSHMRIASHLCIIEMRTTSEVLVEFRTLFLFEKKQQQQR